MTRARHGAARVRLGALRGNVANEGDAVSHAGPANEESFTRSLFADPALGPLRGLLLTLTVVTGVVDAVSILALGRVFVANMTGNVVFAAFALVGAPGSRSAPRSPRWPGSWWEP